MRLPRANTCYAPFCDEHANYWSWHKYITVARLGVAAIFFFGLIAAAVLALSVGPGIAITWAFLCVLAMFGLAALTAYMQSGRIERTGAQRGFPVPL